MNTKPKNTAKTNNPGSRWGSFQSYILGFLSATLVGYFLLYNHFIQIGTISSGLIHSKDSALSKTTLRPEDKVEIQQLLRTVDQLYEKMKKSQSEDNHQILSSSRTSSISDSASQIPALIASIDKITASRNHNQQMQRNQAYRTSDSSVDSLMLKEGIESSGDYKGLNLDPLRHHLSASHSKDIVFALAANIDPKYFAIFIKSFRKFNKEATMFVFVNKPVDNKVKELAEINDVMLIDYTIEELQPAFLQKYHPSSLRWVLYDRILSLPLQNGNVFGSVVEKVLALDARDSAFQRDPFALFSSTDDRLLVFGEDRHSSIGSCGWNSAWVRDCFPRDIYDVVANQPIICSGISMGAATAMSRYVQRMSNIITGIETSLVNAGEHFPHCERNGVDQGIHNVLVHTLNAGLNVQILYPEEFPVVNMQSGKEQTIIGSEPGINGDIKRVYMTRRFIKDSSERESFAVVHQFDRDNDLQASLAHEYIDWINWGNTKSEWSATPACAKMSYVDQADLFKAMCDIGAARAISAATCCEACARKTLESGKRCTGFTYYGGVCYLKNCDASKIQRQKTIWDEGGNARMRLSGALSGFTDPALL